MQIYTNWVVIQIGAMRFAIHLHNIFFLMWLHNKKNLWSHIKKKKYYVSELQTSLLLFVLRLSLYKFAYMSCSSLCFFIAVNFLYGLYSCSPRRVSMIIVDCVWDGVLHAAVMRTLYIALVIKPTLRYDTSTKDQIMRNCKLPFLPLDAQVLISYWLDEVNRSIPNSPMKNGTNIWALNGTTC